ncbi:MAG: hypothetical protein NTY35_07635 [Planctomycetota bacterium]|nr:hypothetical protein [Planctomycetota bacterium]
MHASLRITYLAIATLLPLPRATAQWSSEVLHHFDPAATLEFFGGSLAVDQDSLIVGAANADGVVARTGAAYVYVRAGGTWSQQARLVPGNGITQDSFGSSVAIRGDLVAVGSPHHQPGGNPLGRVHVFRRTGTTWTQEATIPVPVADTNPLFGTQVVVLDERILVSAPNGNSGAGVVYRFDHVGGGWVLGQTIVPPDPVQNLWFGQTLSSDGPRLAIGANSTLFPMPGGVYLYDWAGTSWLLDVKLLPARLAGDGLGSSIALQQDTLLAGCSGADFVGTDEGGAFFWKHGPSGWAEDMSLRDCRPSTSFASDVHLDQDTAIVSSRGDDEAGAFMGSIYVFRREAGQWSLQTKIVAPDALATSSYMGPTLLVGDRVFLGTPQALGTGRVWEFRLLPATYPSICVATWSNDLCAPCYDDSLLIAGSGCENSALNCGTQLVATGSANLSAVSLVLRARGLPLATTAVLFQGSSTVPAAPFGAGVQCVGGSLLRIATRPANSGGWTYPLPGDPPLSAAGSIPAAGALRHYQLAYRDVSGFCGGAHSNLTNGVSVSWTP